MSNMQKYFKEYFSKIKTGLNFIDYYQMDKLVDLIEKTKKTGNKIIIAGNGGSASLASHLMVDFTNAAKIRAVNFNEP